MDGACRPHEDGPSLSRTALPRAVKILEEACKLSDDADLVFPSPTGRMLSDTTISKACPGNRHRLRPAWHEKLLPGLGRRVLRCPARSCELALAHVNNDRVEAAYRRSDLFEQRRELMAEWAAYIGRPPAHRPEKSAP